MALITCPECGKEYSNLASACPNCGCPTHLVNHGDKKPHVVHQKKKANIVDVKETETSVVKTYKQLPSIPNILTWIGLIWVPLTIFSIMSTLGTFSMINNLAEEEIFNNGYISDGQLSSIIIFGIVTVIAFIGILRIKKWGLLMYVGCKLTDLLFSLIFFTPWGLSWSGILLVLMPIAIYLASFMFEECGHNAFEILLCDGVIKEKKPMEEV